MSSNQRSRKDAGPHTRRSRGGRGGRTEVQTRKQKKTGISLRGNPANDTRTIIRMPMAPLFPARSKVMMLPYYAAFQVSSGAVAAGNYVFSLNGLYDPDVTGTGSQPMGFDQMMVFYEHYTVLRAKVVAVVRNQSTSLYTDAALSVRADNVVQTDIKTIMETGNSILVKLTTANGQGSLKEVEIECDIAVFGGIDDLLDNSEVRGTAAANPTEQTFLHVSCWNSETVGTVNIWVELRIQYYAVFTEARVISTSTMKKLKELVLSDEEKKSDLVIVPPTKPCRC